MNDMKKMLAIVLIAGGVLALVYRGFTYTKETHSADIPVIGEVSIKDKEHVSIPTWAGIAAIVAGGAILLIPGQRGRLA